jgi:hypothetical protein
LEDIELGKAGSVPSEIEIAVSALSLFIAILYGTGISRTLRDKAQARHPEAHLPNLPGSSPCPGSPSSGQGSTVEGIAVGGLDRRPNGRDADRLLPGGDGSDPDVRILGRDADRGVGRVPVAHEPLSLNRASRRRDHGRVVATMSVAGFEGSWWCKGFLVVDYIIDSPTATTDKCRSGRPNDT